MDHILLCCQTRQLFLALPYPLLCGATSKQRKQLFCCKTILKPFFFSSLNHLIAKKNHKFLSFFAKVLLMFGLACQREITKNCLQIQKPGPLMRSDFQKKTKYCQDNQSCAEVLHCIKVSWHRLNASEELLSIKVVPPSLQFEIKIGRARVL